jgi:membrane protein YqaA with SNARE-associated domain
MISLLQQAVAHKASTAGGSQHAPTAGRAVVRYFFKLGLIGLFLISAIDSSPIPLPIPGSSDVLVVLLAAARHGWIMVTIVATLGSIAGAAVSYQAGVVGGFALLDRYVPTRFRDRMRGWSEKHSLLSVALPAILPPPAPLMPFLIAAGALKMPRRRFYLSFTISRFARHAFFAWLGVHYGRHIMPMYMRFADKYGWMLLVAVWGSIGFGVIYAIVKLKARKTQGQGASAPATA